MHVGHVQTMLRYDEVVESSLTADGCNTETGMKKRNPQTRLANQEKAMVSKCTKLTARGSRAFVNASTNASTKQHPQHSGEELFVINDFVYFFTDPRSFYSLFKTIIKTCLLNLHYTAMYMLRLTGIRSEGVRGSTYF